MAHETSQGPFISGSLTSTTRCLVSFGCGCWAAAKVTSQNIADNVTREIFDDMQRPRSAGVSPAPEVYRRDACTTWSFQQTFPAFEWVFNRAIRLVVVHRHPAELALHCVRGIRLRQRDAVGFRVNRADHGHALARRRHEVVIGAARQLQPRVVAKAFLQTLVR